VKGQRYFKKFKKTIRSFFDENEEQHFHEENIEIMHSHPGYSKFSELLRSYIPKNVKVLDLGCNKGLETAIIAKTNEVVGIDFFADFIKIAKEKRCVEALKMDFHNMTFHKEFDCVYSNNSMEHSRFPEKVVGGVSRALRKNGIFIIGMPTDGNNPSVKDPAHHFRATMEQVIKLLKDKFKILEAYEIDTKEKWNWEIQPSNNKMLVVVAKVKD